MLAAFRAASFYPIEKVITSPSPSGRGVGVRADEPPAKVPAVGKTESVCTKTSLLQKRTPQIPCCFR